MGMSFAYGPRQSEEESFKVLTRAADMGVTFWDTADVYGYGHNEGYHPDSTQLTLEMLGKWFKTTGRKNEISLATKFGHTLDGHRTGKVAVRGDKEYVKEACDGSLKRLGLDQIDLYYMHR
jgi:aryl-alcohol dehydrogenase-like predicted oxidoreductase